MTVKEAPLRAIKRNAINPAPYNPRRDLQPDDREFQDLDRSIQEWGLVEFPVWNERTGNLVGGHQRLKILDRANEYSPVVQGPNYTLTVAVVDLDDANERALNIALNRIGGEWDMPKLADLLRELQTIDFHVPLTGYTPEEAEDVFAWGGGGTEEPGEAQEDTDFDPDPPPEAEAKSRSGEIYQLGRHRLICGDSTDPEILKALLGEPDAPDAVRPTCVWTDPPYGVKYEGGTGLTIENDRPEDTYPLLLAAFRALTPHLAGNARFYIAAPAGPQGLAFRLAIQDAGWRLHQVLCWGKDALVLGHSDYHYKHEDVLYGIHDDVLYGWAPGEGRPGRGKHAGSRWYGDNKQTTLFLVPRPRKSTDHPTMKPVALIDPHIRNSTKVGDPVFDGFGGSGSTLMTAHQLERTAYLVEKDPAYCDVIRRRFAEWTGDDSLKP